MHKAVVIADKATGDVLTVVDNDKFPMINPRTECVRVVEVRLGRVPTRLAMDPRTAEPHRWNG